MIFLIPLALVGVGAYGLWKYQQSRQNAQGAIFDVPEPLVAEPTIEPLAAIVAPLNEVLKAPDNPAVQPSTFGDLTSDQQLAFLKAQARQEGVTVKGSIANRLNNPGNLVWAPVQAKFGGAPGETIKGPDGKTRVFTRFPSLDAGYQAQQDLWARKYSTLSFYDALKKWVDPHDDKEFANYVEATLKSVGITKG
jgi:hypothetical protein